MYNLLPTTTNFQFIQAVGLVTDVAFAKPRGLIRIAPDKFPALLWRPVAGAGALTQVLGGTLPVTGS